MKKVKYLIEYANAQVGRPYWCGTYGKIASESYYQAKKKQYPTMYWQNDYWKAYGQKVHDCCGLIKGAMWCNTPDSTPTYVGSQDHSVKGFYQVSTTKGRLTDKTPLVDGLLLFNSSFGHMGVYDKGYVINAKGHAYGVVKEPFIRTRWYYWSACPYFDYEDEEPSSVIASGDIVRMSKDATVYGKSVKFSAWVYDCDLTVVEVKGNRVVVSVDVSKGITGAVHKKYLSKVR